MGIFHLFIFFWDKRLFRICLFLQETYEVLDTLLYDKATTGHKSTNWHTQNGTLQITTDDNGTSLENTGTGSASYVANLPSTSPSGYDAEWEVPFCIEFDIVDCTDLSKCYLQVSANNSSPYTPALNANGSVIGSHQKIECRASGYTIYIDYRTPVVLDRPINDLASIRFAISQGETLKYKNFKIYPI